MSASPNTNLAFIELAWRRLMVLIGRTLPATVRGNRAALNALHGRMGRR